MLFTLEVLPAEEGDCLLLHWGTKKKKRIALIDGGPGRVYENSLRPRLDEIVDNLGVDQLPLEFVMVSHLDSDHIVGIKKLFAALRKQIETHAPIADRTIRAERLWMNIFNDILGDSVDAYYDKLTSKVQASVNGQPSADLTKRLEKELEAKDEKNAEFQARSIAAVLASHGEGRTLRDDQRFLFEQGQTAALNSPFAAAGGKATLITLEKTKTPKKLFDLKFTVVGPMQTEIEKLQKEFDEYIKKKGLTVEAMLAAYADDSVKNLSSLACLVTFTDKKSKKAKTILLTGDARGDLLLDGLKKQKLLKKGKLVVDILKVPHHGSDNNVEPEFFEKILADTYVLSGDGNYGNPERNTLQWIVDARGKTAKFDLILTYDIAHIDKNRKADFEQKQKRKKPADRRTWDDATMSLASFFAKTKGHAYTLRTGPHAIDLGDETVDY